MQQFLDLLAFNTYDCSIRVSRLVCISSSMHGWNNFKSIYNFCKYYNAGCFVVLYVYKFSRHIIFVVDLLSASLNLLTDILPYQGIAINITIAVWDIILSITSSHANERLHGTRFLQVFIPSKMRCTASSTAIAATVQLLLLS